jgi:cytochrome c5
MMLRCQTFPTPFLLALLLLACPSSGRSQLLTWDATSKQIASKRGETNVVFVFNLTNRMAGDVVIEAVKPSCGCTVARFPDLPWKVQPGESGQISVDVDITGRIGLLTKTIAIETRGATNLLTVNVQLPELTQRELNQRRAFTDRQAVFKAGCAECHKKPALSKMGEPLYKAACGICHDAVHRADMVPDLHALNKPTDRAYWDQWIRNGKPGTFMPAFAKRYGGPLEEEQILSLLEFLTRPRP